MQYFSEDMQDEGNFENNLLIKLKKEFYLYDNPISSMEVTLASLENSPDVNAVSHSYEKRGYLTQFWPIRIQNKAV